MTSKKILPINYNTYLSCYSHHVDMLAIAASDYFTGNLMGKISELEWKFDKKNVTEYQLNNSNLVISRTDKIIEILGPEYGNDLNCEFYNIGEENCIFTVKILGQKFTNPWANMGVYIGKYDDGKEICLKAEKFLFGYCCRSGVFDTWDMEILKNLPDKTGILEYPVFLRTIVNSKTISCYISYDGEIYEKIKDYPNQYSSKYVIGLRVENWSNQFYNWFFSNYIQIHCDNNFSDNSGVPIDFFFSVEKYHWANYFNYFIDYDKIKREIIKELEIDFVEYIKTNISSGGYVEVRLNEFYIENRDAYQKYNYDHDNLIYGFDDSQKVFNVMGFSNNQVYECSTISYQAITDSFYDCVSCNKNIGVLRYQVDYIPYQLNIKLMIGLLQDYLNGTDSGERMEHLTIKKKNRTFGIKVYDVILSSKENFNKAIGDVRILHLIFEHKKCMLDRYKLLVIRGILSNDEILLEKFYAIYQEALTARNYVIKNSCMDSERNRNKIKNCIHNMKNMEEELYPELIYLLRRKVH